jgi:hypothetical protein
MSIVFNKFDHFVTLPPVPGSLLAQGFRRPALDLARPGTTITAALHWHRTPATGALVFLFLSAAKCHFQLDPGQ